MKVHFEDQFIEGIRLEATTRTNESSVGTDRCVFRAASFKRLPNEQRSDKGSLPKLVGTPWTLVPSDAAEDEWPVATRMDVAPMVDPRELLAARRATVESGLTRRVCLRRGEELGEEEGRREERALQTIGRGAWQRCWAHQQLSSRVL